MKDQVLDSVKKDIIKIVALSVQQIVKKPRTDAELKDFIAEEVSSLLS
jgi:hypothetical protein